MRIWAVAQRIVRQFRHDRRTLVLLFIVPLIILTLLGPLIDTEVTLRLGLNNKDEPISIVRPPRRQPEKLRLSGSLVSKLKSVDNLVVKDLSQKEIKEHIKDGRLDAAIIIGRDYSRRTVYGGRLPLKVILEGSNPQINQSVIAVLQKSFGLNLNSTPKLKIEYQYGGKDLKTLDYYAPVFIAFFVFFFVFLLTSVSFLRERGQGTVERLLASPIGRFELITGYLIGFFLFAAVQSVIILLYTIYILKTRFAGALWQVLIIELLLTVGSVNLGIFLSSFARTELQVVQFIPVVVSPQALLSGMIWPINSMPYYLQLLSKIMPLTYVNVALHDLMVKGLPLADAWPEIIFLVAFALAMMFLSVASVHRRIA